MTYIDRDLELDLIGAALADQDTRWDLFTRLDENDFGDPQARKLWRKLHTLSAQGADISFTGAAKLVGSDLVMPLGQAYELTTGGTNLEHKVSKLRGLAQARRYQDACRVLADRMKDADNPSEVLAEHVQEAMSIVTPPSSSRIVGPEDWPKEAAAEARKRWDEVQAGGMPYLDLGFPKFSRAAAVLEQNLVFIAAQTKGKKSLLSLNIAAHVGMINRIPILYLNTEMSKQELMLRAAAIATDTSNYHLRTGASAEHVAMVERWAENEGAGGQLHLTDSMPHLTSADVVTLARQYKHQHGIKSVVVDYVQRLRDGEAQGEEKDWQVLLRATSRLKSMAQDLKLYVFVVAQMKEDGNLQQASMMKNEVDGLWTFREEESPPNTYKLRIEAARHVADNQAVLLRFNEINLRFREVENGG